VSLPLVGSTPGHLGMSLCYALDMSITEIATDIQRRRERRRPTLIGIEGYGGSGKTTIARQLADALGGVYVVSIDDFIVREKLAEPSWDSGAFDLARLECQVLAPSSREQTASYQRLQWETNTLGELVTIPLVDYLIVEGISAYHPSIEHYYEFKMWVDTPVEVAQQRGRVRDGTNENAQFWELWTQNDLAYQKQYQPDQRADYVLRNG
jgi:uridine kinase